jgi:signal transduction histidine kinase
MHSPTPAAFIASDDAHRADAARHLRDDLLQTLTALTMDAAWVRAHLGEGPRLEPRLGEMVHLLRGAVATTERIATGLSPLLPDRYGLAPAIESLADDFAGRTGAQCELALDELLDVDTACALCLFRIVQDWLRCAGADGAQRVRIRLAPRGAEVRLQVQDDARMPSADEGPRALALAIARERARLLHGTVTMKDVSGLGTQLQATLPARQPLAT